MKALVFILFISIILLRAIYVFLYDDKRGIKTVKKEEAIKYIPIRKTIYSKTGLGVPLSDAFLLQIIDEKKTWYLTIEQEKLNGYKFSLQALHDSLIGFESNKKLHLTNESIKKNFNNQSFRYREREKYFITTYGFLYYFESIEIPDTIMIYLIEKDENYEFYPTPSDSVAYVRKIE